MSARARSGRILLLEILLILSLVLAASASCPETKLEVLPESVTVENAGALTPGMAVVMSVRVDFPDKENTTYPETSQLELTSGLDNPLWTWNIVRNGVKKDETEERKSRVIISGDDLSWPANVTESLDIHLYGTAPPVMEPKRLVILRILDVTDPICNDPVYQYSAYVLNTTITRERIDDLSAELALLRADASTRNLTGTSTTRVMEQIEAAQRSLGEANATPAFEFVSIDLALNRTEAALDNGRRLLEEATVSGTAIPEKPGLTVQQEQPGTPSQTPASADPAPVLTAVVACIGAAAALRRSHER